MLVVLAGLPEPTVNHIVRDPDTGEWLRRFELAYRDLLIAIEYEGRQHRDDDEIWAADIDRREELDRETWRVVQVISKGLFETPLRTLQRIDQARVDRGAATDPSLSTTSGSATFPAAETLAAPTTRTFRPVAAEMAKRAQLLRHVWVVVGGAGGLWWPGQPRLRPGPKGGNVRGGRSRRQPMTAAHAHHPDIPWSDMTPRAPRPLSSITDARTTRRQLLAMATVEASARPASPPRTGQCSHQRRHRQAVRAAHHAHGDRHDRPARQRLQLGLLQERRVRRHGAQRHRRRQGRHPHQGDPRGGRGRRTADPRRRRHDPGHAAGVLLRQDRPDHRRRRSTRWPRP